MLSHLPSAGQYYVREQRQARTIHTQTQVDSSLLVSKEEFHGYCEHYVLG